MDLISSIVMPIARMFWGFVSMCLLCAGLGGLLAGVALWHGGVFPGGALLFWMPPCVFLIWIAEPTRKRYLKWVRVEGDGGA